MNSKREWKIFGAMAAVFGLAYYLPLANPKVIDAILEAFKLLQWYAMAYHVLKQTLGEENWSRHMEVPDTSHLMLYRSLAQRNPVNAADIISRHFD